MTIPNEISDAAAYQQSLLAALDGDDPAEAQATTPAVIRALIAEAGSNLRTRPEPGEWAVLAVSTTSSMPSSSWRLAIGGSSPTTSPRSSATTRTCGWTGCTPWTRISKGSCRSSRPFGRPTWRCGPKRPTRRARVGLHGERGPESVDLMFRMIGGHDRVHLGQARRTLEAVRARG